MCARCPPRMRANICFVCTWLNSDIQPHVLTHAHANTHYFAAWHCNLWPAPVWTFKIRHFQQKLSAGGCGGASHLHVILCSSWALVQLVRRSTNYSALVGRKSLQAGRISIRCHHTPEQPDNGLIIHMGTSLHYQIQLFQLKRGRYTDVSATCQYQPMY